MEDFAIAQERRGEAQRENSSAVSEKIEKSAIKGYLICTLDYNTRATLIRVKTSV
jgi:hypothetical protein